MYLHILHLFISYIYIYIYLNVCVYIYIYIYKYILKRHYKEIEKIILHKRMMVKKNVYIYVCRYI